MLKKYFIKLQKLLKTSVVSIKFLQITYALLRTKPFVFRTVFYAATMHTLGALDLYCMKKYKKIMLIYQLPVIVVQVVQQCIKRIVSSFKHATCKQQVIMG